MTYTEKLLSSIRSTGSTLCVGLDPNLSLLPEPIKQLHAGREEQVLTFCKTVIDQTAEHCAAYKPNLAFFEALGGDGLNVLKEVMGHIPEDKIVVADAKRGDISTTAEHYKISYFDVFKADALTINPLMGFETLEAFAHDESKALYVLTLTSNSGANDFLKRPFEQFDTMAQFIADQLAKRSPFADTHLGMVIGATQADEAQSVIQYHPDGALLIPGIGAQGGSIEELEIALKDHKGLPLINSSRGILYAGKDLENWPEKVAEQALSMKNKLQNITQFYVK